VHALECIEKLADKEMKGLRYYAALITITRVSRKEQREQKESRQRGYVSIGLLVSTLLSIIVVLAKLLMATGGG
jgi:hypothetical protein